MKRTRRFAVLSALFLPVVAATGHGLAGAGAGQRPRAPAPASSPLAGTWRQVKGNFNGKEFVVPEGRTIIKMHTARHYVFIDVDKDGTLVDMIGGTYTLTGNKYETMPTFGFGGPFARIKGKAQSFDAKVEGNRWHHKGTLTGGLTIDEVWERVD